MMHFYVTVYDDGMKKHLLLIFSLLISQRAFPDAVLANSFWGEAAKYAGINVATLYGIAVHESGMHWSDGSFRPWPWTLNINKGNEGVQAGPRRYVSRQAAEVALVDLIKKGIRNVDVGIMQVNLYWHADKVENEIDLLDPRTNIKVAADYLKNLKTNRNITKTVSDYHSPSNLARGIDYVGKIKRYEKIINEKIK